MEITWVILIGILLIAAIGDWRARTIPNAIPIAVILLYIVAVLGFDEFRTDIWLHIMSFGVMFILGLFLFSTGVMGGGDIKLMAALALWHPISQLPLLIFSIGASGGLLALAYVAQRKTSGMRWESALKTQIPYGVAILMGQVFVFLATR